VVDQHPGPLTLVWDTSPLYHAALADRLDVLGDVASGPPQQPWRNVTTAAVDEELGQLLGQRPQLPWLEVVHVDGLDEIIALARWVGIVSASVHNRGEATVLAWADTHGAVAIIDDRDARRAGARNGLTVHGTLWICARAVNEGRLLPGAADGLIRALADTGARFPVRARHGFTVWARAEGLLPS